MLFIPKDILHADSPQAACSPMSLQHMLGICHEQQVKCPTPDRPPESALHETHNIYRQAAMDDIRMWRSSNYWRQVAAPVEAVCLPSTFE